MADKFFGTIDELKIGVENAKKLGTWQENTIKNSHQFKSKTGEILNWWPSNGTISFQGKNTAEFKSQLLPFLEGILESETPKASNEDNQRIFIVHGHDREARDQLELVLMRLGLQPFILQNSDAGGKTIVEALEKHIYKSSSFGIILMTPDDYGYSRQAGETEKQARARQNVILEMGMVMASLGRDRMAILKKGALETPSDTDGIIRIEFNDHVREGVLKLAQRLQGAGFVIDSRKITAAAS